MENREIEGQAQSEYVRSLAEHLSERPDAVETHEKVYQFVEQLKSKYPDLGKYRLFHNMIGSTPPDSAVITDDLPGEDSIVIFLEQLLKEPPK